jgi:hypothetical protein
MPCVKGWLNQLLGAILVMVLALAVGGFVLLLRAQQNGLAASMAAANIRSVTPPDGATSVPVAGEVEVQYLNRPEEDPVVKFEPVDGVVLGDGQWNQTTYILHYGGLRENSLYHVDLDQDTGSPRGGEHKQVAVRWSFRTGSGMTTATPSVSPSVTTPQQRPTGLIWFNAGGKLQAVDWNGKAATSLSSPIASEQSPDGSRLWNTYTPGTAIYDASGKLTGSIAGFPGPWADDSRQFCAAWGSAGSRNLVTLPFDGSVHTVGPIQLPGAPTLQLTPTVIACSDLAQRAVVVGVGPPPNEYIWSLAVISLKDGSVIYQRRYPNPVTRVVASHDGRYIAEQEAMSVTAVPYTIIRELPSGNVVGQFSGLAVAGFSWDGSLVAGMRLGTGTAADPQVVRWQGNQIVWSCSCSSVSVQVLAQPGGSKLAIVPTNYQNYGPLTIVDATGAAHTVNTPGPATPLF